MRSLLTKREVAMLLGKTPRWVEINRSQFTCEPAPGCSRNGRRPLLYHLSSLPPEAQAAWARRQGGQVVKLPVTPVEVPGADLVAALSEGPAPTYSLNLTIEAREEAERRYQIIEPLVRREKHPNLWIECKGKVGAVIGVLSERYSLKRATIYKWTSRFRSGGMEALAPKLRQDKDRPRRFNNAALDFLVAAALPRRGAYGKLSVRDIYRAYKEEQAWRASHVGKELPELELRKYARYLDSNGHLRPDAQLPSASYRTFAAWFSKIPQVVKVMAREGEEAFSNTQEIISWRDLDAIAPMDFLVLDHRLLDVFCLARDGRSGWRLIRPWLTGALDMRTRKWISWAIVEVPSSDSIASVLKKAFTNFGLWRATYVDNGKDFRAEWLEGRKVRKGEPVKVGEFRPAVQGVLETLGVRVHHAIPTRARSKIIEPNFVSVANFDRQLPEYCGHKPSARPEALERMVKQHDKWIKGEAPQTPFRTIEEIAALYDEFLESLNEREHSGEGMAKLTPTGRGWMCPNECWELLIRGVEIRRVPEAELTFCFHKKRTLRVKHGEIRATFGGRQFHYRLNENPVKLMAFNGREVELAFDPYDLGTVAVYCDQRFLGLASNAELRGMGEQAFVVDEKDRRAGRREVKKFIDAVHKAVHVPTPEERLARRAAVQPARRLAAAVGAENYVAAELPAAIVEASAAAQRESEFSFANCQTLDLVAIDAQAYRDDDPDDDSEFRFFQDQEQGGQKK